MMAPFAQALVLATWLLAPLRVGFSWRTAHVWAQAMIPRFTMISHVSCRRRDLTPDLRQARAYDVALQQANGSYFLSEDWVSYFSSHSGPHFGSFWSVENWDHWARLSACMTPWPTNVRCATQTPTIVLFERIWESRWIKFTAKVWSREDIQQALGNRHFSNSIVFTRSSKATSQR